MIFPFWRDRRTWLRFLDIVYDYVLLFQCNVKLFYGGCFLTSIWYCRILWIIRVVWGIFFRGRMLWLLSKLYWKGMWMNLFLPLDRWHYIKYFRFIMKILLKGLSVLFLLSFYLIILIFLRFLVWFMFVLNSGFLVFAQFLVDL